MFDEKQKIILNALNKTYPGRKSFQLREINDIAEQNGIEKRYVTDLTKKLNKVTRGVYDISNFNNESENKVSSIAKLQTISNTEDVYIPDVDKYFVRWGHTKDVEEIIKSKQFYPVFITGLSGNGKTLMVEQVCAKLKRNFIRVQISPETDEDDLIGGFRLVNGETVFAEGPIIRAMKSGAILLIDEIDRSSNKIMCLQGVLEGNPVLIKKTGELVKPELGFNIFATANTKGKGSDDGRFIAASIIDEAFLERFVIAMEQPYPTPATEKKIVLKHMEKYGKTDADFAEKLVVWSEAIRKTFIDGGVDELISTRRLCHIAKTFAIFNDKLKSIKLCVARFDEDTKEAFVDLYTKIDAGIKLDPTFENVNEGMDKQNEILF